MKRIIFSQLLLEQISNMKTDHEAINKLHEAKLYLHFYDDLLSEERTNKECQFIFEKCKLQKRDRVLDLACGHGRHSLRMSELGLEVTGVDMNAGFIKIAKELAVKRNLEIEFTLGDILELNYPSNFDAVILLYNSFGFFNKLDGEILINRISKSLKIGGRLLIDVKNKETLLNKTSSNSITEKGADLMIDRLSFDSQSGIVTNKRIYIKEEKRYDTPFSMQLYNYSELKEMLTKNNLKITNEYGSWEGDELNTNSRRLILILEKFKES